MAKVRPQLFTKKLIFKQLEINPTFQKNTDLIDFNMCFFENMHLN